MREKEKSNGSGKNLEPLMQKMQSSATDRKKPCSQGLQGSLLMIILKTSASGKRQEVLEFCIRIPAEQSGVSVRFLRLGKSSDTNFKINLYKPANASFLEAFGRFMLPAYRLQ